MKFSNHHSYCLTRALGLLLALTLLPSLLPAQRLVAHRGSVPSSYNFWFYIPEAEPAAGTISVPFSMTDSLAADGSNHSAASLNKPLVVFLHGASLCGRKLSRVRSYGTLHAIDMGLRLDAYVLAPQNPGGAWNPAKVNQLIDWAEERYAIDTNRIYVLGMSLGGYGTIDYCAASSDRVAAAMALCGGATTNDVAGLCNMPMCIMHGTGDRDVSWQCSQSVVDIMRAKGDTSRLIYKLLPRQSHGALARYLYLPATYRWLFEHSLADRGRPVNRSYDFGIHVLDNVYAQIQKPTRPLLVEDAQKEGSDTAETSGTHGVHVVRSGDSLSRIAQKHHTSVARLCRLNGLKRTSTLQLGQKVRY